MRPWVSDVTKDPRGQPTEWPLVPFDAQIQLYRKVDEAVEGGTDLSIEKSRKMAATWTVLLKFLHSWLFKENQYFTVSGKREDDVDAKGDPDTLFFKMRYVIKNLPDWMRPELGSSDDRRMHLKNPETGSSIDGKPSTGAIGRSGRRKAMFFDEHPIWETGGEAWTAAGDTTPCRISCGTAMGRNNKYYELVKSDHTPTFTIYWANHPEYSKGLYTVDEDGNVNILKGLGTDADGNKITHVRHYNPDAEGQKNWEWVKWPDEYPFMTDGPHSQWEYHSPWFDFQCRRRGSVQEIAQELEIYYARGGEAFFDTDTLKRLEEEYCQPERGRYELEWDYNVENVRGRKVESVEFRDIVADPTGHLRLWKRLDEHRRLPQTENYIIAGDVSKGTGASNSTMLIVTADGEMVGELADPHLPPEEYAQAMYALAKWVGGWNNRPFLIWDANGPGINIGKRLKEWGYEYVYRHRDETKDDPESGTSDKPGWFSAPGSRGNEFLMAEFRSKLSKGDFVPRSPELIEEAKRYVRKDNGKVGVETTSDDSTGARKAHGDRVVAAALAALACEIQPKRTPSKGDTKPPRNSFAWRRHKRVYGGGGIHADRW